MYPGSLWRQAVRRLEEWTQNQRVYNRGRGIPLRAGSPGELPVVGAGDFPAHRGPGVCAGAWANVLDHLAVGPRPRPSGGHLYLPLRGAMYAYLDGSTRDRGTQVDRFQKDPEVPFSSSV